MDGRDRRKSRLVGHLMDRAEQEQLPLGQASGGVATRAESRLDDGIEDQFAIYVRADRFRCANGHSGRIDGGPLWLKVDGDTLAVRCGQCAAEYDVKVIRT